jgi:hypothetical protein
MLINLVVALIILGVLLWLVNNYLPMDGKIKQLVNIVVVLGAVIWCLQAFGVVGTGGPLMTLIIGLVVLGVLLWAINSYIPMDGKIKTIVNVVVVVVAVIAVLQAFGVIAPMHASLRM